MRRAVMAGGLLILLLAGLITAHVRWLGGELSEWVKPERSLTMVGVLAGFIVLSWQLNRQHRNSIAAEAVRSRNALWLEIYREIAIASDAAASAFSDTPASRAASILRFGFGTPPSIADINDARFAAIRVAIELMRVLERWEIALGGDFEGFKQALTDAMNAWSAVVTELLDAMRESADKARAKELDERLMGKSIDVAAVIWDLRIASQNRLLSGLFTYRVPIRKPGDPGIKVVTVPERRKP